MRELLNFFRDCIRSVLSGGLLYKSWMSVLVIFMGFGAYNYSIQFQNGLAVTGMNDVFSWGMYISNFTFLVGLAAAAVMLVLPAYVLGDKDFPKTVLIGEGVAVGALVMCITFVTVDVGSPTRLWHMIPFLGYFNWPMSMLTWDLLVLNGYLALNLSLPFYMLYCHYRGKKTTSVIYKVLIWVSVFWAVGIHMVTAFLYQGLGARPLWNTALLGPRFLATAFSSGPAFIILVLFILRKWSEYKISDKAIQKIALIITVAAQINMIMLGSEIFKDLYQAGEHSQSLIYMLFGLHGHNAMVIPMRLSVFLSLFATLLLTIHPIRRNNFWLGISCVMLFVGVWIEKGMGLIVSGLIPAPLGDIMDYSPSSIEIGITLGIWGMGLFLMTALIKAALPIELGKIRYNQ